MTSKTKKAVSGGGKGKKGQGFGKERVPGGGGLASPLATFEDDDMYQEPIKKVGTRFGAYQQSSQDQFILRRPGWGRTTFAHRYIVPVPGIYDILRVPLYSTAIYQVPGSRNGYHTGTSL